MKGKKIVLFAAAIINTVNFAYSSEKPGSTLEEIIVTAQKHTQSLQDTPLSISVLDVVELEKRAITSLDDLVGGLVPSLNISPSGNATSSLSVSLRGDGSFDVAQPTRASAVAIYDNGIYLGRAQGLNMELADLERIEVIKGPQGTLFGRNSTSGAINIVSHRPTGEFGIKQAIGAGNLGTLESITRVNFPNQSGISAKIDYLHSSQDGWVENTASGQSDFNEIDKTGGKISTRWTPRESITIDYSFDRSEIKTTHLYYQLYEDSIGIIGRELEREDKTRFSLLLKPTIVDTEGHSLIAELELSENTSVKSLTAHRNLQEDGFSNYGGTLVDPDGPTNGLIIDEDVEQEQFSQEFQILGAHSDMLWVAGIFYFEESADFRLQFLSSLDLNFEMIPPVGFPPTLLISDDQSVALYAQGSWARNDLALSTGVRFTRDRKSASRSSVPSPDIDSNHTDSSLALTYSWSESISSYCRWASAYKAGGYNVRSASFEPYDEEVVRTWEIGFKSELFDQRMRFNWAAFKSRTQDKQFDFNDPDNIFITETRNAVKDVKISGVELDATALAIENLLIGFHYTYLDGDMPLQPNPDVPGAQQEFELVQTPKHAGSLTIDYTMKPLPFGSLSANFTITSTDGYAHSTTPTSSQDGYTLIDSRITLENLPISASFDGNLTMSLWAKNLTDEKYANIRFKLNTPDVSIQSFGTPRTYGINFTYEL